MKIAVLLALALSVPSVVCAQDQRFIIDTKAAYCADLLANMINDGTKENAIEPAKLEVLRSNLRRVGVYTQVRLAVTNSTEMLIAMKQAEADIVELTRNPNAAGPLQKARDCLDLSWFPY